MASQKSQIYVLLLKTVHHFSFFPHLVCSDADVNLNFLQFALVSVVFGLKTKDSQVVSLKSANEKSELEKGKGGMFTRTTSPRDLAPKAS